MGAAIPGVIHQDTTHLLRSFADRSVGFQTDADTPRLPGHSLEECGRRVRGIEMVIRSFPFFVPLIRAY
jgi:hypothetical protein